jgi:hypothetical protein
MWVVLGGGLAGYLLVRWAAFPVSNGEGALVGLLSGVFGAVISSILDALRWLVMGDEYFKRMWEEAMSGRQQDMPPGFDQFMDQMSEIFANPEMLLMLGLITSLVLFSIFALIGGLLAVAIFGPRKFPPSGPPPIGYPPGQQTPGVYIPPPVMPQPPQGPPSSPPEFKPGPGQGQTYSGPQ